MDASEDVTEGAVGLGLVLANLEVAMKNNPIHGRNYNNI
jgi:hypothetical protein